MNDDLQLLEAWREGDKIAGNALVRRHFSSVFRFFRSKLDDGVEDLTQQALLALLEARVNQRAHSNFRAYLFGIARRQLITHLRGRHRANKVFSPLDTSIHEFGGDSQASLTSLVAAHREQRLLIAALRSIPLDFQIVVELYYWEQLKVAEIAEVMDVAPGTVKSRLSRARDMLERRIEGLARQRGTAAPTDDELNQWVTSVRGVFTPPT
ncbi:ECF RNA polymerase sigma-E factor [Enhygromyxa salina]|uniref:ECF RNA polymerase sigma-E factor n=1 Tax=Enhygromyxa salina TaxID=215803 RepID=A0A2S9XGE4_9BACT|nr:RNA polymerase sigma factor [Enhygromyxa salina]PRP91751.1 ECF RNA polymerase sigma-E factor [Enhygromyxa salina]